MVAILGLLFNCPLAANPPKVERLLRAIEEHDRTSVDRILAKQPELIDEGNTYGVTPLIVAVQNRDDELTKALVRLGANVDGRGPGGHTPLHWAARGNTAKILRTLIESGANVESRDHQQQTPLVWAAASGCCDAIELLISAGAQPDGDAGNKGLTPLMFAARNGHTDAAMALIRHGADVSRDVREPGGGSRQPRRRMTPLMLAVESGHFETAIRIVDAGADPNDDSSGYAPLHALAFVRRPQLGDNPDGDPPPRIAGAMTGLEFVEAIIARGADINHRISRGKRPRGQMNTKGATPFLMASQTVDLPLMRLLLSMGADPSIGNADECTPLLVAAGVGNHHVGEHPGTPDEVLVALELLLDLGLDINHTDKTGETTMHGAAYRLFPEVVAWLDSHGADVAVWDNKNEYGWTPMRIAKGYRPGSFKPDPPTQAALEQAAKSK